MPDESTPGGASQPRAVSRRRFLQAGAAAGLAAAPLGAAPPAGADPGFGRSIRLADRGTTHYRVYLGADEDAVTQHGAAELSSYLQQITGAEFPVVSAAEPPPGGQLLVVGQRNPVARRFHVDYSALGDDGFALRTRGLTVLVAGPSPRGTLYGVFWLLDRLLGVRWFAADYTVVPDRPSLRVPAGELNADHTPRFRYREVYSDRDPAYRQHNLLNGGRGEGSGGPAGLDTWSTYWPYDPFGANFHKFVPDQSLWHGGQLLCMDPRTRALAADNIIAALRQRIADGKDPSYGFEQQDTGWTPDPASQQFADAHGGALSAPVLDLVNDVIARVREAVPAARLSTQAYNFSLKPPTGIRPSDGVVMTVAPIKADFSQSLFAGDNAAIPGRQIATWCGISRDVVLWDYITSFGSYSYVIPFPDWWAVGEGINALAQFPSAQGYFGEGAYNTVGIPFVQLRLWVISRLLWDPDLDGDSLIREFLDGYYGAAGDDIYQYMTVMLGAVRDTKTRLGAFVSVSAPYLTFDALREADRLMARAAAAVGDDPDRRAHVQGLRLGVDYVILVRRNEYQAAADEQGVDWDPDTDQRLARLADELAASGMAAGDPDRAQGLLARAQSPLPPPVKAQAVKTTAGQAAVLAALDFSQGPWAAAGKTDQFFIMNTGATPPVPTTAYLLWDEDNLYVGYENVDPGLPDIPIESYVGNSVQTFVKTGDTVIQGFFTNPDAEQYYYKQESESSGPKAGTAEWATNVGIDADSWNVVQAIPFSVLGLDPADVTTLSGLLFRNYNHQKVFIGWGGGAPWHESDLHEIDLVDAPA